MPLPLTVGLSAVLLAALAVGVWLWAVVSGAVRCNGFPCGMTVWWQPVPMFALAVTGAVLLVAIAAVSRAFTRMSAVTLPLALLGACCGLLAVSGVVALVVLVVTIALIGSILLVAVVDGI